MTLRSISSFKNSVAVIVVKIGVACFTLLFSSIVVKFYGKEVLGCFFILLSIFMVISALGSLGLYNKVLKDFSVINNIGLSQYILPTFASSLFLFFILSYFRVEVESTFISNNKLESIGWKNYILFFLSLPFYNISYIISHYWQAKRRFVLSSFLAGGMQSLLLIILTLWFVFFDYSSDALYWSFFISNFLTSILSLISIIKASENLTKPACKDMFNLVLNSTGLLSILVISMVFTHSFQLIISLFLPANYSADFGILIRITALFSFLLIAVNKVASPKFASLSANKESILLNKLYYKCCAYLSITSFVCFVCLLIFSNSILNLFNVKNSIYMLWVLSFSQFINCSFGPIGNLLQMSGNTKIHRDSLFMSSLIALVLTFILTPLVGLWGAVIGYSISLTLVNLLSYTTAIKKGIIYFWRRAEK